MKFLSESQDTGRGWIEQPNAPGYTLTKISQSSDVAGSVPTEVAYAKSCKRPISTLKSGGEGVHYTEIGKEGGVWTYHVAKRESQPLCILGVHLYCLEASFCCICCVEVGKRGGGGHACPANVCLGLVFGILRV